MLRLVYRLLFLLTAEERGLMGGDPLYRDHYGVGRLRRLCTRRTAYTDHDDLWLSLRALWLVLTDERMARLLDAPPLNGELFAHQELDDASIANRDLLRAFWHLAFYREGMRRRAASTMLRWIPRNSVRCTRACSITTLPSPSIRAVARPLC